MKRSIDFVIALIALISLAPLLLVISLLIFLYDFHSPFYMAPRVGRNGSIFRMAKFRSMVVNADKSGVTSTAASDKRITPIGHFVRRYKLDELIQLWNVFLGHMSLVGPRPNVPSGVAVYTAEERKLLNIRPGITDFASIVFADEGQILEVYADADVAYDRVIRPYKSQLGLFYVQHSGMCLDFKLIVLTVVAIFSRKAALIAVSRELRNQGAPDALVRLALREAPLMPAFPPGSALS